MANNYADLNARQADFSASITAFKSTEDGSGVHTPHVILDSSAVTSQTPSVTLSVAPVRAVAGVYAAGDCVGTDYVATPTLTADKTYLIRSAQVQDPTGQGSALDVLLFQSALTDKATKYVDNSAPDAATAATDSPKILEVVSIAATDYVTFGNAKFARVAVNRSFKVRGDGDVHSLVLVGGTSTPTYASAGAMPIITLSLTQID